VVNTTVGAEMNISLEEQIEYMRRMVGLGFEYYQDDSADPMLSAILSTLDEVKNGNWTRLIKEHDSAIGNTYIDEGGKEYIFIGLLHGQDDYYYVMWSEGNVRLLTCVGELGQMGFKPSPEPPK
jgi:hypothetical protein